MAVCVGSRLALGKEGCVVRETKAEKAAGAGLRSLECKRGIWSLFCLH